jgi:acyl carrier protein
MFEKLNREDIYSQVAQIIANQINTNINNIKMESTLDSLSIDSLDRVEIIMKLEETFNIMIKDEDADKLNTIEDIVNYINNNPSDELKE